MAFIPTFIFASHVSDSNKGEIRVYESDTWLAKMTYIVHTVKWFLILIPYFNMCIFHGSNLYIELIQARAKLFTIGQICRWFSVRKHRAYYFSRSQFMIVKYFVYCNISSLNFSLYKVEFMLIIIWFVLSLIEIIRILKQLNTL